MIAFGGASHSRMPMPMAPPRRGYFRRHSHRHPPLLVVLAAVMTALFTSAVVPARAQECCSACIGKVAESPYDYDPLIFDQCKLKPHGTRICCFDCGSLGDPSFDEDVTYADDGTTPTVKAGTWVKMQWPSVTKVTYVTLKDGQKKLVTPTVKDPEAKANTGYFMICAKAKGSLILRGWGNDTCREASTEKTLQIVEGAANATCEAKAREPPPPTKDSTTSQATDHTANAGVSGCNLSRASVKNINGKDQCVCVSDWSNPPACDQMPAWKWAITIGGGIAALLSILISVRAFVKSREKKKRQLAVDDDPTQHSVKEVVETIRIGGDRPSSVAYRRDHDDSSIGGVDDSSRRHRQPEHPPARYGPEFTL